MFEIVIVRDLKCFSFFELSDTVSVLFTKYVGILKN